MGACTSKPSNPNPYAPTVQQTEYPETPNPSLTPAPENDSGAGKKTPIFPFYSPSPARYFFGKKSSPAPGNSTPRRFFRRPPSPARHIKAVLVRRKGKGNGEVIDEEGKEGEKGGLNKSFGYSKEFKSGYEVGVEVGRGHFGYTCSAKALKGELKGQQVAVKIIPKSKVGFTFSLN